MRFHRIRNITKSELRTFGIYASPQEMYAHFDFLMNAGVAGFIVARSAIHGDAVRIANLDNAKLRREKRNVQRQLKALRPRQVGIIRSFQSFFARARWWFSSTLRTVVTICGAIVTIAAAVAIIGHVYSDLSHHKAKDHVARIHAGHSSKKP
jgi:hypothetical protein